MKKHLGVLAGAFNPFTRAHLALAEAALTVVDEVVCVVPRAFPHKHFQGASLDERIEMLQIASAGTFRVETTARGLFGEIALELRTREDCEISFICGRDAAERVITWDYGEADAIERMLEDFSILVAARGGTFEVPAHLQHRVRHLTLSQDCREVSSTEVRRRIEAGEPWEHLVPVSIAGHVRRIYAAG